MEGHISFTIENNIVYYRQGQLMGSNWKDDKYILRNNVYWRTDGKPVEFPGKLDFEKWMARGVDKGSVIADPLFVDAEKYDFRLKENSPALKLGFKPIDISKAGRLTGRTENVLDPPAFPTMESK
jgi:hypothetical protein